MTEKALQDEQEFIKKTEQLEGWQEQRPRRESVSDMSYVPRLRVAVAEAAN